MAPQERTPSALSNSSSQSDLDTPDDPTSTSNRMMRTGDSSTLAGAQLVGGHHDRHFYYLSDEAAAELPLFQYRGKDLSLTYKYVLSPFAEWCVHTLTPRSVAPNTITLTGLVWMIASYVAMWYYVPALLLNSNNNSNDDDNIVVLSWVFILNAVAILIYQTLDNMDGKQARRIGASSPLGLLFDHGCDAINSVFGSANWMVALALSRETDLTLAFVMLMGPYALFYVTTWEEYYTGQLIMPILNGPNEGLLGAVAVSIVSAVQGTSYWHQTDLWDTTVGQYWSGHSFRNADLLILATAIAVVRETVPKISDVTRKHGIGAAQNLLPFATLVVCCAVVGCVDVQVWLQSPRTSLHLCAILFVEMTTELMLKHITKQPYQAYRWILAPLVLLTVAVVTDTWPGRCFLSTSDFLMMYAAAAGMYLAMKTIVVIDEICAVLGIWCFDIVTPRKRRLPRSASISSPQRVKTE